jgi:hypothetical protein
VLKEGEETLIPVNTDHLFRNDSEEECEFDGTVSERNYSSSSCYLQCLYLLEPLGLFHVIMACAATGPHAVLVLFSI